MQCSWQGLHDRRGSLPRSHNLHRSLQSAWQPTLSSASLTGYAPAMNAAAERLVARLSAVAAKDGEADMLARFFRVAVDIVGTAVFGCAHAGLSGLWAFLCTLLDLLCYRLHGVYNADIVGE